MKFYFKSIFHCIYNVTFPSEHSDPEQSIGFFKCVPRLLRIDKLYHEKIEMICWELFFKLKNGTVKYFTKKENKSTKVKEMRKSMKFIGLDIL